MKRLFCTFVLALMMPALSLAVTEGVVESAPQVTLDAMQPAVPSYLPDASYYAGYGDWLPAWENAEEWVESRFDGECYHDVEQRPRMTAGESARAKALLAAYRKGEAAYTGENILGKMDNVIVGVYALEPDNFAGEKAFTILPGPCMTDEQILAVIDAFDQLGLAFDPDSLSERNCARGGGVETNRFFTDEERERYTSLARLIEKGMVEAKGLGAVRTMNITLDSRYFCGLPDFTIRPYRAATDAEMVAQLFAMGKKDMTGVIDADETERGARKTLYALGAPLSMALEYVFTDGTAARCVFDAQGNQGYDHNVPAYSCYGAMFSWTTADGYKTYAYVMLDHETDQLISAHWANQKNWDLDPGPAVMNITDTDALAAAKDAEGMLGLDRPTWFVIEEETFTDWGACRRVRTQVEADLWLTVLVGGDDGKVHGVDLERGGTTQSLPEDIHPVNG